MVLLRFDRKLSPGFYDVTGVSCPVEIRLFETAFSAPAGSCPIWAIAVHSTALSWLQLGSKLDAVSGFSIAGRLCGARNDDLGIRGEPF